MTVEVDWGEIWRQRLTHSPCALLRFPPIMRLLRGSHALLDSSSSRLPLAYWSGFWSLIILLLLSSGPVYAEWVPVAKGDDGLTVYVDPDTIRRNGNLVKMWLLYDYKTTQTKEPGSIVSAKMQSEYDGLEESFRSHAVLEYSGNMGEGKLVFTNTDVGTWAPISPGSIVQLEWKRACRKK